MKKRKVKNVSKRDEILKSLEPLFKTAEESGLWFYCYYQDLWLSAQELRISQSNGRFIWGADNWQLRDPQERVSELERAMSVMEKQLNDFKSRMKSLE